MEKQIQTTLIVILVAAAIFFLPKAIDLFAIGEGNVDQSQTNTAAGEYNLVVGQSFTPSQSTLSKIEIYLGTAASPSNLYVTLYDSPTKTSNLGSILNTNNRVGWNEFVFSSPISLTPGHVYYFEVTGETSLNHIRAGYPNPYANGQLYVSGPMPNYDLTFKTYYSGEPQTPQCTSHTYSTWGNCQASNTQTRTLISSIPTGCSGGVPVVLSQSCTYVPPIRNCSESDWTSVLSPISCPVSEIQTKTWTKIGVCTGGVSHPASEVISCDYSAPTCTSFTYTAWNTCPPTEIQTRTLLTSFPTGCTGGSPILSQICDYSAPTCTSFTYSAYDDCHPSNLQYRNVLTSSPTGCTGGSPILQQACVYNVTAPTCTSFTYTAYGNCTEANQQFREILTKTPTGCTGGNPVVSKSCTYQNATSDCIFNIKLSRDGEPFCVKLWMLIALGGAILLLFILLK